jgi:hypothetical protein
MLSCTIISSLLIIRTFALHSVVVHGCVLTTTRDNSAIMAPINDAVAAFDSQDREEQLTVQAHANCLSVNQSTLSQRICGATFSRRESQDQDATLSQRVNLNNTSCLYVLCGDNPEMFSW